MQHLIDIVDGVLAEGRFRAAQFKRDNGAWTPACGGTETQFYTRTGRRLLYCWQQSSGRHAYIDLGTDIALSDEEARAALGTY